MNTAWNRTRYHTLQRTIDMEEVAILYICTGNYAKLWQQFYESAKKNFLPKHSKHFYVWTDQDLGDIDTDEVSIIPKFFEKWPAATIQRYKDFNTIKSILLEHKYVYFCNADLHIYKEVGDEFLPDEEHPLVGVQHIQYDKGQLLMHQMWENTEHNIFSHAYIDEEDMPYTYIFGCLNGGFSKEFMEMSEVIAEWTEDDSSRGIVPIWHDESYLNAYRLEHPELFKVMPADYAYPDMSGVKGYDPIVYKLYKQAFFSSNNFREYTANLENQHKTNIDLFFSDDEIS